MPMSKGKRFRDRGNGYHTKCGAKRRGIFCPKWSFPLAAAQKSNNAARSAAAAQKSNNAARSAAGFFSPEMEIPGQNPIINKMKCQNSFFWASWLVGIIN